MASGFGYGGGTARCFTFWQEFQKCYAKADHPGECRYQSADYLECLHHTKEKARAQTLRMQALRTQSLSAASGKKEADVKATGAPVSVGLINIASEGGGGEEAK